MNLFNAEKPYAVAQTYQSFLNAFEHMKGQL
jgi:hypothetical protein